MQAARILLALFSIVSAVSATSYRDCGSRESVVQSLEVTACPDGTPICTFTRGTNASIQLNFTPQLDINQLSVRVYGIIGGIPVEFTMPQPNACIGSGLSCPLALGQPVQYLTYVPVLPMYPNIKAVVKFELVDGKSGLDVVCAMFPVQIVGSTDKKAQRAPQVPRKGLEQSKPEEQKRVEKLDRLAQRLKPLLQSKKSSSRSSSDLDAGRLDAGSSLSEALGKLLSDPKVRERLAGPAFWDTLASLVLRFADSNPNSQKLASYLEAYRAKRNERVL